MHWKGVTWTLGFLAAVFGGSMLVPIGVALFYGESQWHDFLLAASISALIGLAMMRQSGGAPDALGHRDGFLIVALAWLILALMGAIPFWLTGCCRSIVDGLFESTSGLTTTGATVLSGLDDLPRSVLFWRSQLEWVGGMGIILLAVAVMPLLGVGGMQLFRAEMPGPVKDKLTARVTETAKMLWFLYLAFTLLAAIVYWALGMSPFDAVNHAMTTIAIGGFSTHDASIGFFESKWIHAAVAFFMILAGINFTLHFLALKRGFSVKTYLKDEEFRAYTFWLVFLLALVFVLLGGPASVSADHVMFNVISIATTTGFAVSDFGQWPPGAHVLLLLAMFVGACAGSTGGGMKVVRVLLLFRQGMREIRRLIHPHAVIRVKLGKHSLQESVVQALWGFAVLYIVCFAIFSLILAACDVDLVTAFSASAACITNTGPGLGSVGPASTFADLPEAAKGALVFAMILGRLEIFTFFVLLVPEFWRR